MVNKLIYCVIWRAECNSALAGAGYYLSERYVRLNTPVGTQAKIRTIKTAMYHGMDDFATGGLPSYVVNRYATSYYSGTGTNFSIHRPFLQRSVFF
jgi:hypothetical protein